MARKPTASDREVLETLLAAWSRAGANDPETDAELVLAIEIAGQRAARGRALPKRDWLAIAKAGDPIDRGLLLATVEEGPRDKVVARWAAIAAFDDPRVSGLLAQRNIPTARKDELGRFLNLLVAAARDRRVIETIERTAKKKYYAPAKLEAVKAAQRQIKVRHRAVAKASVPLTTDELALVRATIAADGGAREASAEREAELLAAVYAAPLDNGPREVYADWLLERQDPRGEFIALQLASETRRLTEAERAREDELFTAHRRAWLGPLAAMDITFYRGFPAVFRWHFSEKLVDDPRWSTAERTDHMPPPTRLRALIQLYRARNEDIVRLGELAPDSPLEVINWMFCEPGKSRDAAIAAYREAKLPALRVVEIQASEPDNSWEPSKIGWVFEGRSLTTVEVPGDPRNLATYFDIYAKRAPTLECLKINWRFGNAWITRDDDELALSLTSHDAPALEGALLGLESLPPNRIASLKFSTKSKAARTRDRVVAAVARHEGCKLEYGT